MGTLMLILCGMCPQATGLSTLGSTFPWAAPNTGAIAGTVTMETNTAGGTGSGSFPWWREENLLSMVLVPSHGLPCINAKLIFGMTCSICYTSSSDTPSQRVQFLLGTEDDDEEHIPHELFTEMDEICVREGEDSEWRESARYC